MSLRNRLACCRPAVILAAISGFLLAGAIPSHAESACEALSLHSIVGGSITTKTVVGAGEAPFRAPRAFCRVQVTVTPTPDSDIKVEVWMPLHGWNGRLLAVGNGDSGGAISYTAMTNALSRGYATSSTDTGHTGNSMAFALGHRQKYVDFGYRSLHEMTVKAKAIIDAFYGTPPLRSYWNGCSQGGRQGITEAARYPSDYDAIIAGAPAIDYMRLHAVRMALNLFVHRSEDSYIPPEKYPAIHRAVLEACDAVDGLTDGLIQDPTRCGFDPGVLACPTGDAPSCLTAAQVETARGMYSPITVSGRIVSPALLQPGSELEWGRLAGPEPLRNAVEGFKYVVFHNPAWDWHSFSLSKDLPRALRADAGVINLTNPDLDAFFDRGGKLMMYHGWADPQVTPLNSVRYFKDVLKATGERRQRRSIELYMEPGVSHCWGGEGPDAFDVVGALEQWEEAGVAPAQIIASQSIGIYSTRTRPLCPYPQVATYTGFGSTDSAENFRCASAMPVALQASQHQLAVVGPAARAPDAPSRAESRRSGASRSGSPP